MKPISWGDEDGFYQLWQAVGKAMVSKQGQGSAKVRLANGCRYQITTLRVDQRSYFLKLFSRGRNFQRRAAVGRGR